MKILHEDDFVIVIDKPEGLLTTHTKLVGRAAREAQLTAENVLTDYVRKGQWKSSKRVWLVHRLDRETSGVMMFAKSERIAAALRERWGEVTEKTYLARVEGRMSDGAGTFESFLKEDVDGYRVRSVPAGTPGAKRAKTAWRVRRGESAAALARAVGFGPVTRETELVEVTLHTGRKNQIRVHFSEAGHPVVGDVKYGAARAPRLCLHAWKLAFDHPVTGRRLTFESTGEEEKGKIGPRDNEGSRGGTDGERPRPRFLEWERQVTRAHGGNLSHWQQTGCTCFVTWRTEDALPQEKLAELAAEQAEWRRRHPEFFAGGGGKEGGSSSVRRGKDSASPLAAHPVNVSAANGDAESLPRLLNGEPPQFTPRANGDAESFPRLQNGEPPQFTPCANGDAESFPRLQTMTSASSDPVLLAEYRELFYGRIQKWLDAGYGKCALARDDLRVLVERTIRHFDGVRYVLYAYVVMPNHVHVLFMPLGENRLENIIASWKRFSARQVNGTLGTTGAFWQKESWDYLVRNARQFDRFVRYVKDNCPGKSWNAYGL